MRGAIPSLFLSPYMEITNMRRLMIIVMMMLFSFNAKAEVDIIPLELLEDLITSIDIPAPAPLPIDEREQECLAKNIYFEARNEPYEGKLAVATVTRNRVESGIYPDTYCDVVWQQTKRKDNGKKVAQFSWTLDGKPDNPYNLELYQEALEIAEEVLRYGKKSAIIGDRVYHYHAVYVQPKWSRYMKRVTRIGNHIFYRS